MGDKKVSMKHANNRAKVISAVPVEAYAISIEDVCKATGLSPVSVQKHVIDEPSLSWRFRRVMSDPIHERMVCCTETKLKHDRADDRNEASAEKLEAEYKRRFTHGGLNCGFEAIGSYRGLVLSITVDMPTKKSSEQFIRGVLALAKELGSKSVK